MRQLVTTLFALAAISAQAQIGPPSEVITIGFPITVQTGDVTNNDDERGRVVTAGGGVSSPIPGFVLIDIDALDDLRRYNIIDVTGGMAVAACFLIPCSGIPEQIGGTDTGEGWAYVDGVFLPRFDTGILKSIGAGAIGGGATFGASGAGSSGGGGNRAWVDAGPQLAYGLGVGDLSVVAMGSYSWGFEGGSQKVSGRGARFKAHAVYPVGGYSLIGTFAVDRRTDDAGTEDLDDDFEGSFVTFGVGLGF